jgi:hypothetical protein
MPDAASNENSGTPGVLNASRLVSDDELSEMRAGFFTAAGAKFDFGASVQTLVNGKLALQTNLQWTSAGPVTQQVRDHLASIPAQVASTLAKAGIATPEAAMQSSTGAAAQSSTAAAPDPPAASAPAAPITVPEATQTAPVSVAGDAPALVTSVQIPGATGGTTQILANIGPNQIQNIVLNSASGQDITQNTNVTLTIHNFANWQQQVAQRTLSAQLVHDMLAASGISAGH